MKLVNSEYNILLEFEENNVTLFIIEEKLLRLQLVSDLYKQCLGATGNFVLSENSKILKMNKVADILITPFSVDYNNKKILSKLYEEISNYGNEILYTEKEQINSNILLLLDRIMLNVPYNITTKLNFDFMDICKLYNVQFENTGNTLLEQLIEYIKIMSQLCSCKLFFLLNFSLYLTESEIKMLYECASYQKIYLVLIEYSIPFQISTEKGCIIDKDGCIINIESHNMQHLPSVKFGENLVKFEV